MLAAPSRDATESGASEADEAARAQIETERRAKLHQHLSAALSTAIVPSRPMVFRSSQGLAGDAASQPAEDAVEDAAYWDLVGA